MEQQNPLPTVLSRHEQYALLDQPDQRYPTEHRNLLFLRLELDNGLRLPEMRNVRWQDIQFDTGKFQVRGVNVRDRLLWLSREDLSLLEDWRDRQRKELEKRTCPGGEPLNRQRRVFTNLDGSPVSRKYLRRMVRMNARRAGIHKTVLPYTLRHTFATDLYLETGNLRVVQKALGLSDRSSIVIYRRLARRKLERALSNLPGAKVSGTNDLTVTPDVRFTRMAVQRNIPEHQSEREVRRT